MQSCLIETLCSLCVLCTDFRIVGGETKYEGRLEVSYNGIWGTVCDDYFDDSTATVACQSVVYG